MNQETAEWNQPQEPPKEKPSGDLNSWMYQTVTSYNEHSPKEKKKFDYEDIENESPNIYRQGNLTDQHLEEFMSQEKMFQDFTFSLVDQSQHY